MHSYYSTFGISKHQSPCTDCKVTKDFCVMWYLMTSFFHALNCLDLNCSGPFNFFICIWSSVIKFPLMIWPSIYQIYLCLSQQAGVLVLDISIWCSASFKKSIFWMPPVFCLFQNSFSALLTATVYIRFNKSIFLCLTFFHSCCIFCARCLI